MSTGFEGYQCPACYKWVGRMGVHGINDCVSPYNSTATPHDYQQGFGYSCPRCGAPIHGDRLEEHICEIAPLELDKSNKAVIDKMDSVISSDSLRFSALSGPDGELIPDLMEGQHAPMPKKHDEDKMLDLIAAFIEVRNSFAALRLNMEYLSEQMDEFKEILDEVEFK